MERKEKLTDHFGNTIRQLRKNFALSKFQVFHDVVKETSWSKYEMEESQPDFLLFLFLLDRMGISNERFDIFLSHSLHDFFVWYEKCMSFVEKRDFANLIKEREKFSELSLLNPKIQEQKREYIDYIIERFQKFNLEKALAHILKAISYTIGNMGDIIKENLLLSSFEWNLICNYYDLLYEIGGNKEVLTKEMLEFYSYIKNMKTDNLVKANRLPRLALVFLKKDTENLLPSERLAILKEVLSFSLKFFQIQKLPEILTLLMEEEEAFYKKRAYHFWEKSVKYLLLLGKQNNTFSVEVFREQLNYLVISDVLREKRKEKKLSIEEVSGGICDVKTYRNVEQGKVYPRKSTLKKISDKLELPFQYFRGEVETSDIRDIFLCNECRELVTLKRMDELKVRLDELKSRLDLSYSINRQTIDFFEFFMNDDITEKTENSKEKLYAILNRTKKDKIPKGVYVRKEIEILSLLIRMIGESDAEEGIGLLEAYFRHEKNFESLSYPRIALPTVHLVYFLQKRKEYERAYQTGISILSKMIGVDEVSLLLYICFYILSIEEEKGNIEKAKDLCQSLFYIAEMYGSYREAKFMKTYYENHFDRNEVWYS